MARARNTILAQFHEHADLTHILYLEADVGIRGVNIRKLMEHGKDVIGAPVLLKTTGSEKSVFNVGKVLSRSGTLATVTHIGTAVLMLSRNAVDKLVELAIKNDYCYTLEAVELTGVAPGRYYDVFRQGVAEGRYISEDYQVCNDFRSLGFDIFADLGIRAKHVGMYEFVG